MEPTVNAGDGFIAIPSTPAGSVEKGDIVVYDAKELDGGGLTTHRIVGETEHGYITQGDANPVTDQDGDEPYVTEGQIVATAWQVNDEPVTVPHLGTGVMAVENGLETAQWHLAALLGTTAVLGTQGLAFLLFVFGFGIIALEIFSGRQNRRKRTRERTRFRPDVFEPRTIILGLAAVLFVTTFATMIAMSGTTEVGIVSTETHSDRPDVISTGETETVDWELQNSGILPVVTVVEPASEGIVADGGNETLHRGESANATVTISAPDDTGYYLRSLGIYQYFGVLPQSVIFALHSIHPWIAMTAVTATIVGLVTFPFALLLGMGKIRTRTQRRTNNPSEFNW